MTSFYHADVSRNDSSMGRSNQISTQSTHDAEIIKWHQIIAADSPEDVASCVVLADEG